MNLYNQPGVPHRGWLALNPEGEDTGALTNHCEMCGTAIRYLYHMRHPEYSQDIIVGSECTRIISEDYKRIQTIKKQRQSCQNRLERFFNKTWLSNQSGDIMSLTYRHYWIVISFSNNYYRLKINGKIYPWHYDSLHSVKVAAFYYISKRLGLAVLPESQLKNMTEVYK